MNEITAAEIDALFPPAPPRKPHPVQPAIVKVYSPAPRREWDSGRQRPREWKVRDAIAARLAAQGAVVNTEVITPVGRIDVMAAHRGIVHIIEVKLNHGPDAMKQALGQVLFYGSVHPMACLWIATPARPAEELVKVLNTYGVGWFDPKECAL